MKLLAIASEPLRHHGVIGAPTRRELASRYRGSLFGSAWMVMTLLLIQHLMMLNPLTVPIEQARAVVIDGHWPAWGVLGGYAAAALVVYALGQRVFACLRPGFADVI